MMNKTLHVCSPEVNINKLYPKAQNAANVRHFEFDEYFLSLADVELLDALEIAKKFHFINFVPEGFNTNSFLYKETYLLLNYLRHTHSVSNFVGNQSQTFVSRDLTRTSEPTLWVFGCSHSHGVGLRSDESKYGDTVAKILQMPIKTITNPGSSTNWSFRHLINTDFNPDDIVVWQLTGPGRISVRQNEVISDVHLKMTKNRHMLEYYSDQQLFFHHISLVNYGVRYLRTNGVKFVLLSLLGKDSTYYDYMNEFTSYPEYVYTPQFIDLGTDKLHAGPLSHNMLAHSIVDHVKLLYDKSIP